MEVVHPLRPAGRSMAVSFWPTWPERLLASEAEFMEESARHRLANKQSDHVSRQFPRG